MSLCDVGPERNPHSNTHRRRMRVRALLVFREFLGERYSSRSSVIGTESSLSLYVFHANVLDCYLLRVAGNRSQTLIQLS